MIKNLILLLALFTTGLLCAQRTVIAGKFPYQRDVPFSVQFVANQITFEDEWGKVSDTSDAQGYFHLNLSVVQPSTLRFSKQESIEVYLRPGDSLWVEMINGRNLRFEGTAARENRLLQYFNAPTFIPSEVEEDLEVYSNYIDSLDSGRIMSLARYETDNPDQDFISLFVAKSNAVFLDHKLRLFKKLNAEGWEGALIDEVRRQLQETLIDEVRSASYLYTLRELFRMEVSQIMGQEIPASNPFNPLKYPPGYEELYAQHWRERLVKKPKLYRCFELEEQAEKIRNCVKSEQLPLATAAWKQIKNSTEYPGFVQMLEEIYQKKVIQYQLRKLPDAEWKDEKGHNFKLLPDEKRTLVVFWDAQTQEGLDAFKRFQEQPSITYSGNLPDSVLSFVKFQRMIWVQVGGDLTKWKQVVENLSNRFAVQHCLLDVPEDIQALKPYLYKNKLPMAFTLEPDLNIKDITDQPVALEVFRTLDQRGRIIWRPVRE